MFSGSSTQFLGCGFQNPQQNPNVQINSRNFGTLGYSDLDNSVGRWKTYFDQSGRRDAVYNDGYVGLGTISPPSKPLELLSTVFMPVDLKVYGTTPGIVIQRSSGSVGAPTTVGTGNNIGALYLGGYDGVRWTDGFQGGVMITGTATENWSETQHGAQLSISITKTGTSSPVEVLRMHGDGFVTIGQTSPGNGPLTLYSADTTAGTIATRTSLSIGSTVGAGVTVTNMTGLLLNSAPIGGAITNRYGIYLYVDYATNNYGLYVTGNANLINRLDGLTYLNYVGRVTNNGILDIIGGDGAVTASRHRLHGPSHATYPNQLHARSSSYQFFDMSDQFVGNITVDAIYGRCIFINRGAFVENFQVPTSQNHLVERHAQNAVVCCGVIRFAGGTSNPTIPGDHWNMASATYNGATGIWFITPDIEIYTGTAVNVTIVDSSITPTMYHAEAIVGVGGAIYLSTFNAAGAPTNPPNTVYCNIVAVGRPGTLPV